MIYYQSKYLSQKLEINLAKWKRWSRAFLPADALGGLQSGVARQFNLKEAFKVFLGGFLVGELKFTIPEATKIMSDLSTWLKARGFYHLQPQISRSAGNAPLVHVIYICSLPHNRFAYAIRTIIANTSNGTDRRQETYTQTLLHTLSDPILSETVVSAHMVAVTTLYLNFLDRIQHT
jgi:hypothetical protein